MWYQYHHWTDQRFGLDRPSTIDACDWEPGRNALCCDVKKPLSAQQSVKFEKTLERQTGKMKRDVERDCTEGNSGHYQVNWSAKKHNPLKDTFPKIGCRISSKRYRKKMRGSKRRSN